MVLSYSLILENIQRDKYLSLLFPLSQEQLQQAANLFLKFLNELNLKETCRAVQVIPGYRSTYVGYRIRGSSYEATSDEKELFHYNEYFDDFFKMQLENTSPVLKEFIASARIVYLAAKETFSVVLKQFEQQFPGIYLRFFPTGARPLFYLRFLKYNRSSSGENIARGHYDLGACTLALAESNPGLRVGSSKDNLTLVNHQDNQALFFPGLLLKELTTNDFAPTWHDVIQKSEITYNSEVARWAIVFFADPYDVRNISTEEAHSMSQY